MLHNWLSRCNFEMRTPVIQECKCRRGKRVSIGCMNLGKYNRSVDQDDMVQDN